MMHQPAVAPLSAPGQEQLQGFAAFHGHPRFRRVVGIDQPHSIVRVFGGRLLDQARRVQLQGLPSDPSPAGQRFHHVLAQRQGALQGPEQRTRIPGVVKLEAVRRQEMFQVIQAFQVLLVVRFELKADNVEPDAFTARLFQFLLNVGEGCHIGAATGLVVDAVGDDHDAPLGQSGFAPQFADGLDDRQVKGRFTQMVQRRQFPAHFVEFALRKGAAAPKSSRCRCWY